MLIANNYKEANVITQYLAAITLGQLLSSWLKP